MSAIGDTLFGGWAAAGVLALALVGGQLRSGRRREALNRCLHELRRPLQLLSIAPVPVGEKGNSQLELAIAALRQLDRELNGGGPDACRLVSPRELVGGAVARWRARAALLGCSIALRWRAGFAPLFGDPARLAQALDNLIVNALQHGGRDLVVDVHSVGGRLRICVVDDGQVGSPGVGPMTGLIARLTGRRRHGHGLEVVRRVAAAHRGRFALQRSEHRTVAVLELPLAGSGGSLAA